MQPFLLRRLKSDPTIISDLPEKNGGGKARIDAGRPYLDLDFRAFAPYLA